MSALAAHAIQQALVAASFNEDGRARAISALRGSEVYAATWPTDGTRLRTLQNSSGLLALALFTDERHLEEAALRFGWLGVDQSVPTRRLHISEAIRFARQQRVALVILDITSDHALELDDGELELVSAPPSSRAPSYHGLGPVVSSAHHNEDRAAVKRVSTRPPANDQVEGRPPASSSSALRPAAVNFDAAHHSVSATFAPAATATMSVLPAPPNDELVESFIEVLREYCEVDWACLVGDTEQSEKVSVAVRIEPAFRVHLSEISARLRKAAAEHGTGCEVLVLDTAEQMKRARAIGLPFYPWRKR